MSQTHDTLEAIQLRNEQLLRQILQQVTAINTRQRFESLGPDRICQFLYADRLFSLHLPFAHVDLIQKRIMTTGSFFELNYLKRIQQLIPPDAIIIDAGANIGNHTVFFAGVCGAASVYSFEPLREIFSILQKNIGLNDLSQVTAINAALGAEKGYANLGFYSPDNIGKSSFSAGVNGVYPMTTIDELNLDRVDFIKMDVEGGQIAALQGAKATMLRCRPRLWVELRRKFDEYAPAVKLLADMGYQPGPVLGPDDFIFVPAVT